MDPERWHQIEKLFHAALEKQPSERGAFLAEAAQNEEMRQKVASLLAQSTSDELLDRPAWQCAPSLTEDLTETARKSAIEERFPPGTILAERYRVVAPLGRGGMGEVYRATDLILGQTVALKFLPHSLTTDVRALNRLYNEVRLARGISHPNVCRVYDIAEACGLQFLTMEYVDGEDLRSLLRRIGRLPAEKATDIAYRLCAGLSAAHDRGVLHRDLKPANIMIDAQGNARITDFGLAVLKDRLDARDLGSGTPAYMAPEQLAGKQVSVGSDIYSLGLVIYEMFGGRNLFAGSSGSELLRLKRETRPETLSFDVRIDPQIERAIMRCLEPDPRNRPSSAAELAAAMSGGDPLAAAVAAGETPVPELVARAGGKDGLPVRVAVACMSTVIAALILFLLLAPHISILSRIRVDRPDVLERVARDTLSGIRLGEGARHHVGQFGFDIEALRRRFDPAAIYFWYRASPDWMVPFDLIGLISAGNPPGELPGMVTTKWDGAGRLLFLKAVPDPARTSPVKPAELWTRLFAAAGLQPAEFKTAEPGWMPAPGWDVQASWTGVYPDGNRTSIRVDAAAWRGQPVYFEVVPSWRNGTSIPSVITTERLGSSILAVFIVLFAMSGVLAWRNIRLGRGDRRGAFRVAMFILVGTLLDWACKASHVPDLMEFRLLAAALTWTAFITIGFWTVYMAFEPYVRRRWPHAIISWTRLLSGKFRDPVIGGHILIGTATGAAIVAVIATGFAVAGAYSPRRPSLWMLSGSRGIFAYALGNMIDAVLDGLLLLFVAFFCRVFLRKGWLAILGTIIITSLIALVVEPPNLLTTPAVSVVVLTVVGTATYLLLRIGLLAAVVAFCTMFVAIPLPLTTDLFAPTTVGSLVILSSVFALALFGFHSTLAGRPLFKLDW